jgi:hypothetical protein
LSGVNLIPLPRILARRRGTLARRWAWICALYSAAVIGGFGSAAATWDYAPSGAQARLDAETTANQDRRKADKSLMEQVARLRTILAANRAVGDQPNWSLLLSLISSTAESRVVLQSCRVEPALPASAAPAASGTADARQPDREPVRYTVQLRGYSRDQAGVSAFALDLERASLFSRVEVAESRREAFGKSEAVRFRLECALEAREVAP